MAWLSRFRSDGGPPKNWVRHALVVLISLAISLATFEQIVDADQLAEKENVVVCNVVGGCNPGPYLLESFVAVFLIGLLVLVMTAYATYW